MMNCWSFLALAAISISISGAQAEYKRVCYVTNWAQYRGAEYSKFFPNQTDPSLCSHIMFAYAVLDANNNVVPTEWNDDIPGGLYHQTLALKEKEPGLKVSIAIGGSNFGMEQVTRMLATQENRATFVNSAIGFCRERGFDGVDLVFQYPGSRGSPPEDKYHFTSLLVEFRSAIDNEAASSGKAPLLLTAAVGALKTTIDAGYEVSLISQYVDFINVLMYDFNGGWDTITGLNAPLYARADEFGVDYDGADRSTRNLDWAARYWVGLGAPKDKLVLGLAMYGRSFVLANVTEYFVGAPAVGPDAPAGTMEPGFLAYYEICHSFTTGSMRLFDDEQKNPYTHKGYEWAGYDDEESLKYKVDYIKENGFSGWNAWSVDLDDFSSTRGCVAGPFPLLHAANEYLSDSSSAPATVATSAAKRPAHRSLNNIRN